MKHWRKRSVQAEPGLDYAQNELQFTEIEREAVYKAIYLRRDIRRFVDTPLPEDAIMRILNAGHHGPSVGLVSIKNLMCRRFCTFRHMLHPSDY